MKNTLAAFIRRRSTHWPSDERQQAETAIKGGGILWLSLMALLSLFRSRNGSTRAF